MYANAIFKQVGYHQEPRRRTYHIICGVLCRKQVGYDLLHNLVTCIDPFEGPLLRD